MLTKAQKKQLKNQMVQHFYEFLWNAKQYEYYFQCAKEYYIWTSTTRKAHTENACRFLVKAHMNYELYSEVFVILLSFNEYDYDEELEEQAREMAYKANLLKWYKENKKRSLIIRNLARDMYFKRISYKRI